jgi:hypothetical protein
VRVQDGRGQRRDDRRQPVGELADLDRPGVAEHGDDLRPRHGPQRVERRDRLQRRRVGARELARPGGERRQLAPLLERVERRLARQRVDDGRAQPRGVLGEPGAGQPRRALERGARHELDEPGLRDLRPVQCGGVGDRAGAAPAEGRSGHAAEIP